MCNAYSEFKGSITNSRKKMFVNTSVQLLVHESLTTTSNGYMF